ncbi:MAG TPA: YegP family protein [Flavobacteriales bacterium]|mgnify:CR=1 FL=1|nr:YegP family protein [Flavobacteriales bacterium]HMR26891.1 YegP family protein [Flavobacteriales bacterium]
MAEFIIQKSASGQFYYTFRGNNHEVVMVGEEHTTKQACQGSIASVRLNAPNDDRYTRWQTGASYYFNLKAANGEKLGASEAYTTAQSRETGISVVKREAQGAPVIDRS